MNVLLDFDKYSAVVWSKCRLKCVLKRLFCIIKAWICWKTTFSMILPLALQALVVQAWHTQRLFSSGKDGITRDNIHQHEMNTPRVAKLSDRPEWSKTARLTALLRTDVVHTNLSDQNCRLDLFLLNIIQTYFEGGLFYNDCEHESKAQSGTDTSNPGFSDLGSSRGVETNKK